MLIYNYKKEFLGIDEKDLQLLGFQNLQGLQKEVNDFADLFVKTPGYIHNFKHVHWIDFITCAESNEEAKVIINVNNKNYKAIVQIETMFLLDNPTSEAYIVHINHLHELTAQESENISGDIIEREAPVAMSQTPTITTATTKVIEEEKEEEVSVDMFDTEFVTKVENPIDLEEDLSVEIETPVEQIEVENFNNGYIYDPTIASNELGLPLDLIEEFIQDFIAQAKEFKDNLYIAIESGDIDNLKTLSHKLKGVAANLRIEDALEALTIINTSSDINIIRKNLDTFYKIVAKLADKKSALVVEDDIFLDIKSYNREEVANTIGLDIESFNELFTEYLTEARNLIETINTAVNSNELTTCKNEALKLKGMSDNMQISSFKEALKTLMNSSDIQELNDALDSIRTALLVL